MKAMRARPAPLAPALVVAVAAVALSGCFSFFDPCRGPAHPLSFELHNETDSPVNLTLTITGPENGVIHNRTYAIPPGGLNNTGELTRTEGAYGVTARVPPDRPGNTTRSATRTLTVAPCSGHGAVYVREGMIEIAEIGPMP